MLENKHVPVIWVMARSPFSLFTRPFPRPAMELPLPPGSAHHHHGDRQWSSLEILTDRGGPEEPINIPLKRKFFQSQPFRTLSSWTTLAEFIISGHFTISARLHTSSS